MAEEAEKKRLAEEAKEAEEAAVLLALSKVQTDQDEEESDEDESDEDESGEEEAQQVLDTSSLDQFTLPDEMGNVPLYYDSATHKSYMIKEGSLEFIGYRKGNTLTQATPDTWSNEDEDEDEDELESMLAQMTGGTNMFSAQLSEEDSSDEDED